MEANSLSDRRCSGGVLLQDSVTQRERKAKNERGHVVTFSTTTVTDHISYIMASCIIEIVNRIDIDNQSRCDGESL